MDTFYGIVPTLYQQSPLLMQQDEGGWNDGQIATAAWMPDANAFVPLQRYMHETHQPWFTHQSPQHCGMEWSVPPVHAHSSSAYAAHDFNYQPHHAPQRYPSPSPSGPSVLSSDNSWCDSQSPPGSSPSTPYYSPGMATYDSHYLPLGGYSSPKCDAAGQFVAPIDVQIYADTQPEEDAYEHEQTAYLPFNEPEEGYVPMETTEEVEQPDEALPVADLVDHDRTHNHGAPNECEVPRPRFRRRHTHDAHSVASTHHNSKVAKRSHDKQRAHSHPARPKQDKHSSQFASTVAKRPFVCPFAIYKCTSSFNTKNEWKRHINTQHMRLGFWRCDLCELGDRKTNDFNRKDLFIQHVRRMHPAQQQQQQQKGKNSRAKPGPFHTRPSKHDPFEMELIVIASRCFHHTRASPEDSGCLFCKVRFTGAGSWDERLEHIGKHMESEKKENVEPMDPGRWQEDAELEQWLEDEDIIVESSSSDGYVLADGLE